MFLLYHNIVVLAPYSIVSAGLVSIEIRNTQLADDTIIATLPSIYITIISHLGSCIFKNVPL